MLQTYHLNLAEKGKNAQTFILLFFLPFLGGKTHNRIEQGKTLAAYTEEIKRFVLETISLKAIFGLLAIKDKVVFLGW